MKKQPFIVGDIAFDNLSKMKHVDYIACDTETKMYYNNKQINDDEAYTLVKENGMKWARENIEVRAYAFQISDGNWYAEFDDIEDYLEGIAMLNVKRCFWCNARFDFAIFDYYFLTNGWRNTAERIEENDKKYQKLADKTYRSLNGEFGQRYELDIWKSYKNRKAMLKVHKFKMVDLCNIFGGGLAKNLADWDIRDDNNEPIRKLEMDYFTGDNLQYKINDVKGLMRLVYKIEETIIRLSGFSFLNGDYVTAGGLAKKALLVEMYGGDYRDNIKEFRNEFYMTKELDMWYRERHLYLGGKALPNPYIIGKVKRNVYKYDVNSMYPDKMRNMRTPYGKGKIVYSIRDNDNLKIYCVKNFIGVLKDGMIPIYQDFIYKEYLENINISDEFLIWEEELNELKEWYFLDFDLQYVIEYVGKQCEGFVRFVDKFYTVKKTSKGTIKLGAKLFLNSAYGKLAQKIERKDVQYELSDGGYVHLVNKGENVDTRQMLSVVIGSRITMLSRVALMRYIRLICKGNVKENFLYCDTDSVHTLCEYDDCDDSELGKMKFEGCYQYGLYLAPKTYLLYKDGKYEVHCKGVNTKVVEGELKDKPMSEAVKIFTANKTFKCLSALNVKGGKALVYVDKMIMRDEFYKYDDSEVDEVLV